MIKKKSKSLQIWFNENEIETYNFCMSIIRKTQAEELAKGNKCDLGDALFKIIDEYNNNVGLNKHPK